MPRQKSAAHVWLPGCRGGFVAAHFAAAALALLVSGWAAGVHAEDAEQRIVLSQGGDDESEARLPLVPTDATALVSDAARRWGINEGYWLSVAWCESRQGRDPNAYLPGSRHIGVFQFANVTWAWASRAAGLAGASPY